MNKIADAGTMSEFAPALAAGTHVIALRGPVRVAETREFGRKIEAEFSILESTTLSETERRGDVWFIDKQGLEGQYAQKRFNSFAAAFAEGLGAELDAVRTALATDAARGLLARVESREKLTKAKKTVVNNVYSAYPMSTDAVTNAREWLDGHAPAVAAETPAPAQAPAVSPTPAPGPASTNSILSRFGISK
jgi:hypothetical protein